jgi:4-methyl-5(b-hydroxyethyl)-thiazole monophosphate biosynthesis
MPKKAIVFLAEGFEEVEAITPIDYLRRAGVEVATVAVGAANGSGALVLGSHGVGVAADTTLEVLAKSGGADASAWDVVVLPGGGKGSENLAASAALGDFVKAMASAGKLVAAICAAPAVVLAPLGLLAGKKFTCYPGMEDRAARFAVSGAAWSADRVVADGQLITSRGAGTAGEFARAIIGKLLGEAAAEKLGESVLL